MAKKIHWSDLAVYAFDGSNAELTGSEKIKALSEFRASGTMTKAVFCDPSECEESEAVEAGPKSADDVNWGSKFKNWDLAFGTYTIQIRSEGRWTHEGLGDSTGWDTVLAAREAIRSLQEDQRGYEDSEFRIVDCLEQVVE